ncbi:MAG: cytochrome c [Steroidobacteraceae bacterium]|nr:cytochrome c [Steroidobacteraceae bacterium]
MTISLRMKQAPALAAVLALVAAGAAQAQGSKEAEAAIKYRQSVYTVIYNNFGPLGAMASGKAPFDAAIFKRNAARVAFMSSIAPDTFPEVSKTGNTKAKPEIWANKAEFDKLMKDFQDKSGALASAAQKATSVDEVKAAFGATGAACKACHDKFKAD